MSAPRFDRSAEYDAMLARGLRLSGEDKDYFIAGRLADLAGQLPSGFAPEAILDFGCGVGTASAALAARFGAARVVGVDTSDNAVRAAQERHGSDRVSFMSIDGLARLGPFDLCHCNGVFHHIAPADRAAAMRLVAGALRPGGYFAVFENNPWNPGARLVMSRIPFDRDAIMLSTRETARLLRCAGFDPIGAVRSLFYFPRLLRALRPVERALTRLPLGAQYWFLARKP